MKETRRSLLTSVTALILCFVMLVGTTFAWFTDSATSANNIIKAGSLDISMEWSKDNANWNEAEGPTARPIFDYRNWEPGYTEVRYIKVQNLGSLAFKYQMAINPTGAIGKLAEVIDVSYDIVTNNASFVAPTAADKQGSLKKVSTLSELISGTSIVVGGVLLPDGETAANHYSGEIVICVTFHMQETAGNEYQGASIGDAFGINLYATQYDYEKDSFDNSYDNGATWPSIPVVGNTATVPVNNNNGVLADAVTMTSADGKISATLPAGTKLEPGVTNATLSVSNVENSQANITLTENEAALSLDVHISGVAEDNDVPTIIYLAEALPVGLNMGNYSLYHVEDGNTNVMTYVADVAELDVHNEFAYDPATGNVTLCMESFSEVAMVAETENAWEGNFDYSWYDANATELVIANADQLAAFGAIVGGMKKVTGRVDNAYTYSEEVTQDSFSGKTVKLVADINLGDKESENNSNIIFYPIGYWNDEGTYEKTSTAISSGFYSFEGTFDGNGNAISNFYQNTWEMKGDHNWYAPEDQHYRDGMGLFGRVYGGTVKNLTVKNFSSDGEIATTGVIAAYADFGATFENIAIFNCNPRVYNIGNGGIVGCVGWYAKEAGLTTTFKNITVDNSNKISALWGSYDVACGGIVGQYYPTSGQSSAEYPVNAGIHFENCHVSAVMDVYNDVCANYQYYAYRYTGMLIGSIRENETIDGHVYPKMDGITASGCTVHFGTWNDYYYCEIIDNTTASYTHDYQMSRLTEIKAIDGTTITYLDGTTDTVPATGRANYVIVDYSKGHGTNNATCYHFKDGEVWTHEMGGYHDGTDGGAIIDENGDENPDLREDKQHIYLEFNNLVTGYGWGVTTKGVDDVDGVTILDRAEGNSVDKFYSNIPEGTEYSTESTVTIGELFDAVIGAEVAINPESIQVAVSPFGTDSTAGGTYVANTTDWTQGTLTFSGVGQAVITITDYYFCNTASVTVNIIATDKFDTNFVNHEKYLYRVGNQNAVALGTIINVLDGANIDSSTVEVAIENVAGNAAGTFTSNATWTSGTIQFTGTGVVKVTIKDATSSEFVLNLEVIDAENLTSATGGIDGTNYVLLKDVTIASGGYVNYQNCTLYGNGFTYTIKGGASTYNSKQGHGIIIAKNATLDNVVIVGDIYDTFGMYSNQEGYNAAIDATSTIIQNCHISNCSTPVRANGVTIVNTTLYGGSVANILISGGTNIFEDVTTVNYNDGRGILGYGILVTNGANDGTKLILNGTLTQYNFVKESEASLIADSTAQTLFKEMFKSTYSDYHFTVTEGGSDVTYVNTAILSMTDVFDSSDITNNTGNGYEGMNISYSSGLATANGYLYGILSNGNSVDNNYDENDDSHKSTVQGDYLPTFEFDLGEQEITQASSADRYIEGDESGVNALYQSIDSPLTLNLTTLANVHKYGNNYNVTASCKDPSGTIIGTDTTVTLNTNGTYTLIFTITDDIFYDVNGNKLTKSVERTYEVPLVLSIKIPAIKDATITITSSSISGTYEEYKPYYVTVEGYYLSFNPLSAISVTDYDVYGNGTTVDLTANISSTEISYGDTTSYAWTSAKITITYTDNRVLTISLGTPSSINSPSTSNGGKTITVTNGAVKSDGYVGTASTGTWPIASYTFKGNNQNTVSNNNGVTVNFTAPSSSSGGGSTPCVTPDTLITMADGSQKEIQDVRVGDMVLAWNFYTGKYEIMPVSLLQAHHTGEQNVLHLYFDDGTELKILGEHGIFDADLNTFIFIDEYDVEEYIGHSFVKQDDDSFTTVKLVNYEVTTEYTTAYTILSADHYNVIAEGMFTVTPAHVGGNFFNPFDIDEDMKYNEEAVQADIEKYGLYTYEDFDHVLTYEQFVALNLGHFKVSVGKGYITYEGLIYLIENFVNNEDFNV